MRTSLFLGHLFGTAAPAHDAPSQRDRHSPAPSTGPGPYCDLDWLGLIRVEDDRDHSRDDLAWISLNQQEPVEDNPCPDLA